ncbi:hypothetical protein Trydic_g8466 [Trypoxylus dichotomus]
MDRISVIFRARYPFTQYIPLKLGKYGLKLRAICVSVRSYAWKPEIYTGKQGDERKESKDREAYSTSFYGRHKDYCPNKPKLTRQASVSYRFGYEMYDSFRDTAAQDRGVLPNGRQLMRERKGNGPALLPSTNGAMGISQPPIMYCVERAKERRLLQ